MGIFDAEFTRLSAFVREKQNAGEMTIFSHTPPCPWPRDTKRNIVLAADTSVELGNPADGSVSFLIWTDAPDAIYNGRITLVGPDIPGLAGNHVPFARIVICKTRGFNAENTYERYRQMDLLRYDIRLSGYMMRGVSQYMREWSRISRDAVSSNFSFSILGGALVDAYIDLDFIEAVEVIFVTSGAAEVAKLETIGRQVMDKVYAMNKMVEEFSLDCGTCEYRAVCEGVEELRAMRAAMEKRGANES